MLRDAAVPLDPQPGDPSWRDAAERELVNHELKRQVLGRMSGDAAPLIWDWDAYVGAQNDAQHRPEPSLSQLRSPVVERVGGLQYVEGEALQSLALSMNLLWSLSHADKHSMTPEAKQVVQAATRSRSQRDHGQSG